MELKAKEAYHKFKFKCTQCGQCCDKTMVSLYPFDIKTICDHLGITSAEFHEKYSAFALDQEGIVRCFLRNRPRCPFKSQENKCSIYDHRPVRCRLYPLGRYFTEDKMMYLITNDPSPGFNSNKRQSIAEWLTMQGVDQYDSLVLRWNQFLIALKDNPLRYEEEFQNIFKDTFYKFSDSLKENDEQRDIEYLIQFMERLYEEFKELTDALSL